MATITVQSLIDRAVAAADMHDNFVTEAQWLQWANQYHKELSVMVAQMGVPYFQYDETISVDGSLEYLIAEPLAIVAVYRPRSDGSYYKLTPMDSIQQLTGAAVYSEPTRFYFRRNATTIALQFHPRPTSGYCIARCITYPKNLVLTAPGGDDSDTVNYPLGWEQFIVLKMAIAALAKEETINPELKSQLNETMLHIETSGRNFLLTDVQKIRDWRSDNWVGDDRWLWV
jgi:hypothetical protein